MRHPRLSRRCLLAGAAAAAVAGCTTEGAGPDEGGRSPRPVTTDDQESAIFDLSFDIETRYRPFDLVAPGFVLAERAGTHQLTDLVVGAHGPLPAPFAAVELTVRPGPRGTVRAGLATDGSGGADGPVRADGGDGGDLVLGCFDTARDEARIEVRVGGADHVVARGPLKLPGGDDADVDLAFAVCENQVTLLAGTDGKWLVVLTERDRVAELLDLRRPDTLRPYRLAWGAPGTDGGRGGDITCTSVRAGLFGMTGIRDQHLVQHADGRPYVRDGKAYFTATCAGFGFFQQAHWGVFTLDLADPTRLEQVAQLYSHRDGLLLGDHAGQVVRDDERDRWIVATSSWGDFAFDGVHVRHVETTTDALHGVHVLETERTPLPTEVSSWDPGLTFIDGRWHVSFVESPSQEPFDFHPALAAAPEGAAWHEDLELVGAAEDLHQCEGPVLARVGDRWWFLASDGDARRYPVFDLSLDPVGFLDAPYETNIPHPQLVPLDEGGYLLVTFDGTQFEEDRMGYGGHGDVLVMRSAGGRSR